VAGATFLRWQGHHQARRTTVEKFSGVFIVTTKSSAILRPLLLLQRSDRRQGVQSGCKAKRLVKTLKIDRSL
jgi:hypothetical protein